MALFGKPQETTGVERVSNALKVFHDTAIELDKGVEEIESEKQLVIQQISDLQEQSNQLEDAKQKAISASAKIKAFLA